MEETYAYKTIASKSEGMYKEKGSKFIGYGYPISNVNQVKELIEELKSEHTSARHFCYAYRIGVGQKEKYRYNDDGEPNNSAGKPIYGQILSNEITNVLIVVVRYFGGTKLGVGGLISAYREGAKEALNNSVIEIKDITKKVEITFPYEITSEVMSNLCKYDYNILNQEFDIDCVITLDIKLRDYKNFLVDFKNINKLSLSK
jgi:uncharacterized YigZ family protein